MPWHTISEHIAGVTGRPFRLQGQRTVGGGCINQTTVIDDGQTAYFVKTNRAERSSMFEAEAAGLAAIRASDSLRAPEPICHGTAGDQAYLVLEHIEFSSGDRRSADDLALGLARMHRTTQPRYGWDIDNTIGSTPQINTWTDDWVDFFSRHRLGYQLDLARRNGGNLREQGDALLAVLPAFFSTYRPAASLLHGDLWGGNWGADTSGRAVIFDPATHYGDRECDLAMTELFGGFPARFYDAYRDAYALDPDYGVRKILYQLYHVLNHFNMFGGGYASQARRMLERLLAEVRG